MVCLFTCEEGWQDQKGTEVGTSLLGQPVLYCILVLELAVEHINSVHFYICIYRQFKEYGIFLIENFCIPLNKKNNMGERNQV